MVVRNNKTWRCRHSHKLLSAVTVVLLISLLFPAPAMALDPESIRADAFILMDAQTGQILLEKNMHEERKPASITKIMTALLALEKGDLTEMIPVSQAATDIPRDASNISLVPEEILSLEDALYAIMLESANEAANAIAEYLGGSLTGFATMMTERAAALGALNTSFANAHGLNDDKHYTTAYDMALITQAALGQPKLREVINSSRYVMNATNMQQSTRIFTNKNQLLSQGAIPFPGIIGGKTGFTRASQSTLVETASRDGRELICVLLLGPDSLSNFQDATSLLNFGFNEFRIVTREDTTYYGSSSFLLHQDLQVDEVLASYGTPFLDEDGARTVPVSLSLPPSDSPVMYEELGDFSLAQDAPESPSESTLFGIALPFPRRTDAQRDTQGDSQGKAPSPFSRPPLSWLLLALKGLLIVFLVLFFLACLFRILRWRRRKKRRALQQQREAVRRERQR